MAAMVPSVLVPIPLAAVVMAFDPARARPAIGAAHPVRHAVEPGPAAFARDGRRGGDRCHRCSGAQCDQSFHRLSPLLLPMKRDPETSRSMNIGSLTATGTALAIS